MGTHLHIPHQIHARALNLHREIRMHALPMLVKELVREARLLVEEDHGAEVGLLIGASAYGEFRECVLVDEVVGAGKASEGGVELDAIVVVELRLLLN
jgi:hypothetical protein